MRRSFAFALLPFLLAADRTPSRPGFTGTWVADLDSEAGLGKDVYVVTGGSYSCLSCTPPRHYAADGKLHPIKGDPDVIAESVRISSPRSIITHLVERTMSRTTTMTVSPDDRTATYVSIDHRRGISQPLKTVYVARRIGSREAGAHAASGTWQGIAYVSVPELIRTTELRDTGSSFSYRVPTGVRYTAPLNGAYVEVEGTSSEAMSASVIRVANNLVQETRAREGKTIMVRTFTLSADGRLLTMHSQYPETGSTFTITAHRKS